jgi:hypothetical protein
MWRRQHPRYDGTRESIGTDFFGAYGRCMHGRAVANVLGNPVLTTSACRLRPSDMLVALWPVVSFKNVNDLVVLAEPQK